MIFVISGGGSTLLFMPQNQKDREEVAIFNALTNAGATIGELNTVENIYRSRAAAGLQNMPIRRASSRSFFPMFPVTIFPSSLRDRP